MSNINEATQSVEQVEDRRKTVMGNRKSVTLSFSLTRGTVELLRAISSADERSMSGEVRMMMRRRADEILNDEYIDPIHKKRIRNLLETDEFTVDL